MTIIDRWVKRTLLACVALAALAAYSNHTTKPCTSHQVGAAGMCVTVAGGTR